MSIFYGIVIRQDTKIQAVYNRKSDGTEFDSKDEDSLREFVAEFLSVDIDHLYMDEFSPFGKYIILDHTPSDSQIIMHWEHLQD